MGKIGQKCDCEAVHIRKVNKIKNELMKEARLNQIADFYKALSDTTRIKIISVLENNDLGVSDIAVVIDTTKSVVSHQLKYLKEMNIVTSKKNGREVIYSLTDDHARQVFNMSCFHIGD